MCVCKCSKTHSIQSWLCLNCVSDIFPFNYITDESEFQLTMYQYFHLNSPTDITKLQYLKINPFTTNSLLQQNKEDFGFFDNNINDECQYMFSEDLNTKFTNKQSAFSLLHLNARSLQKHFDEFYTLVSTLDYKFSAIAVSETWLNLNFLSIGLKRDS